MEIGWYSAAC